MTISKIQLKIGIIEFSGEGDQDWLTSQIEILYNRAPSLLAFKAATPNDDDQDKKVKTDLGSPSSADKPSNLTVFLREKNATSNQTKKFLATAAFLQLNGKSSLSTNDITQSLESSKQIKLNNPSLCLTGNTKKGYCGKSGKNFYVTPEGFASLGINEK